MVNAFAEELWVFLGADHAVPSLLGLTVPGDPHCSCPSKALCELITDLQENETTDSK